MGRSWFGLVILLFVVQIHVNCAWVSRAGGPWFSPPPSEPLPPLGYAIALSDKKDNAIEATSLLLNRIHVNNLAPRSEVAQKMLYNSFFNDQFAANELGTMGYQVASSIYYPLVVLPSLVLGRSEFTLRLGPMVILGLAALAAWLITLRLDTPRTAAAAACLVLLYPGLFGLSRSALPMYGVLAWNYLAAYCWLRSEGFRRPAWCLAGALLTVFTLRGGESLGDGIEGLLAISGVMLLTFWQGLLGVLRREWRVVPGVLMGCLVLGVLVDWDWLVYWLGLYILPQSSASAVLGHHGEAPFAWGAYLGVMRHSALGLVAMGLLAVAVPLCLLRDEHRGIRLSLMASALLMLIVLTLSNKRQNFYLVPLLPNLAMITALGLARVPRLGGILPLMGAAAMVPTWLYLSFADVHPEVATSPVWLRAALGDSLLGGARSGINPRTLPGDVFERPLVELPRTGLKEADDAALWLRSDEGVELLECLPTGSVLVVIVPAGMEGQFYATTVRYSTGVRRSDLSLVVTTPGGLDRVPSHPEYVMPVLLLDLSNTPGLVEDLDKLFPLSSKVQHFSHSAESHWYLRGGDLSGWCPPRSLPIAGHLD